MEVGTGNMFGRATNNGVSWLQPLPVASFIVTPQLPRMGEKAGFSGQLQLILNCVEFLYYISGL